MIAHPRCVELPGLPIVVMVLIMATMATMATMAAGCATGEMPGPPRESVERDADTGTESTDRVVLAPAALDALRLSYAEVEERELSPSIQVPAEVVAVPDRRATLGPRVAGRVAAVRVNVGDRVARGTVLAVLESESAGRAWADLIAAGARERVARRTRDRQRQLQADRVTSERAVEEAEGALLVAEADLQAAQTRLATFGVSALDGAPDDPTQILLASPLAGTVVARRAHVGQWVEPTDTVAEVVDLDELWLEMSVYERDMRFVAVGQPVQADVRAFPDEVFAGTVSQVAGTLDVQTRTVAVRVVLPNRDHRLRPGMFATARISGTHAHEPRQLLAIPWAAVQQVDDHRGVFVRVAEGVFELRSVHTGERAGDFVEVLNGLREGETVVAEGSFVLKGQLLRSTLGEEEAP
jgi:cobalt-zinc-cadmium efflux system membrane fusion protein